jgi:hypothetical protein
MVVEFQVLVTQPIVSVVRVNGSGTSVNVRRADRRQHDAPIGQIASFKK